MAKKKEKISVKDIIQVDSELLENISELIEVQASESLLNICADLHTADIAEIINHLNVDEGEYLFKLLDTEEASEVLVELDENLREKILKRVDTEELIEIVDELDTDDATDIVSDLPEEIAEEVLDNIDQEDSEDVKELLKYPEDTAGGIMTSDFVFVTEDETVKDAIKVVRENADEFEHIYFVYVLTKRGKLVGIISLKKLLIFSPTTSVTSIMEEDLIYVTPEVDQEEAANIIEKYDLVSLPVVDEKKKMLGRITVDDIVDVIQEEATEDLQAVAGLSKEQEATDSIFRISRIRLPWLIIALIIELMAAVVLSSYENFIKELVAATFFIPVVMAMGGSSGSQAAIVMVRGLSTGDIWLTESIKKLFKEFLVAILNSLVLSSILLLATHFFFRDVISFHFSIILSLALLTIIIISTVVGAGIPLFLKWIKSDPAIATGPFVSTTNDILGLIIYLTFITIFIAS
ncbi:magnesium transporter [Bacteroidota bacterium]